MNTLVKSLGYHDYTYHIKDDLQDTFVRLNYWNYIHSYKWIINLTMGKIYPV